MLRDHWYAGCASSRLGPGPVATQVLDQPVVLFRDSTGRAHALLDRCCHRGAPLSLGAVVEGNVTCPYHGWRFDSTGACVHIPSLVAGREIPRGFDVPVFPCLERDGYAWVWTGTGRPPTEPVPTIEAFAGRAWVQGSQIRHCAAEAAIENSLDWCHAAFVHPGTHPQALRVQEHGFRETAYEVRVEHAGMVVFEPPATADDAAVPENVLVCARFELPDRVTIHRPARGLRVVMHFVPTSANTCRMEWMIHHADLAGHEPTWSDEEPPIFAQDRIVLEALQQRRDREGPAFERSVDADASTLLLRRILSLARQGRWEAERGSLRQRRVVPIRA